VTRKQPSRPGRAQTASASWNRRDTAWPRKRRGLVLRASGAVVLGRGHRISLRLCEVTWSGANARAGWGTGLPRPISARRVETGRRPSASPRASRPTPRRSAMAVETMSTRESGRRSQSTGTSWIRRPDALQARAARFEEPAAGPRQRATGRRRFGADRLKPHCASENRERSVSGDAVVRPRDGARASGRAGRVPSGRAGYRSRHRCVPKRAVRQTEEGVEVGERFDVQ